MIAKIKKYFEEKFSDVEENDIEHELRLATAALMIEMMLDDGKKHEAEEQVLRKRLKQTFQLKDDETNELFDLAHAEVRQAVDYHQFTSLMAKNFSQSQKIKVIENLWAIAYADDDLDRFEELMVRRISDLIYVSHSDFMQAKHRVLNNQ